MKTNHTLYADYAYLPQGWTPNVRLHWDEHGDLQAVETDAAAGPYEKRQRWVMPGMVNLHSHAFQRAMAGLTETAGEARDSFWTWRDLMYRYAMQLTPEQMQAIAAQLYAECLRYGYTAVCEFHYLHKDQAGNAYADPAETSRRMIAGARDAGMGITVLPVLYSWADFGDRALRPDQRRFATDTPQILQIVHALENMRDRQTEVGAAPHSLRAANTGQIRALAQALPAHRPIHIHVAEQLKEVAACQAATGKRPVELLLATQEVDARWCLVHATHLTQYENQELAASGAVAGICPTTEGNLGDGFFDLPDYLASQGRFGIGSDSHVSHSPVEELRWLEYGQRLRLQQRNVASVEGRRRVGDFLWHSALQGGAQASGRQVGSLEVGKRADFVALDEHHPNLHGIEPDDVLNTWIFAGNDNLVHDVWVGGQQVVANGRHAQQDRLRNDYVQALQALRAAA